MIDSFVLLTPILLLGIIALLGFVGCDRVFGLVEVKSNPQISSIDPASGTPNGGTAVTITGSDFEQTPTVTFGGTAATNVTFDSQTQLSATTPQHSPATVDVVVKNSDGQSSPLGTKFTFAAVTLSGTAQAKQLSGNPPISLTLSGTQIGSVIVVTVSWGLAGTIAVSDGANTYNDIGPGNWSGRQAECFYAVNNAGGDLTITASGPGTTGPCSLCATEYIQADTMNPVYGFSSKASPSVGGALNVTVTTAAQGDLLYAVAFAQNGNLAVGPGFTLERSASLGPVSLVIADQPVSAPGPTNVDITNSVSTSPWVILALAIRHA